MGEVEVVMLFPAEAEHFEADVLSCLVCGMSASVPVNDARFAPIQVLFPEPELCLRQSFEDPSAS